MGQYKSQYTGPQIDAGINAALNPDVAVTPDSDALVTSGAVADALDNIDPTITSDTDTTLNGILVGNGSKVGTKSLDTSSLTNDADHVPASSVVKSAITKVETDLASIHATGTTNTTGAIISSGMYFYLDGALVQAIGSGISTGAPFTLNTNYKVVTAGGLNSLNAYLDGRIECGYFTDFQQVDGRYYTCVAHIPSNLDRMPALLLRCSQSQYFSPLILRCGLGGLSAESGVASFDSNTKVLTVDNGANAWAFPAILYPRNFVYFTRT